MLGLLLRPTQRSHVQPTKEVVLASPSLSAPGETFAAYTAHLEMACRLLGVNATWRTRAGPTAVRCLSKAGVQLREDVQPTGRPSRRAQLTLRWHAAYSESTLHGGPERGQQPSIVSQKQESSCGRTAYLDRSAARLQRRVRPSRCHQAEIRLAGSIRKSPSVPQGGPAGT